MRNIKDKEIKPLISKFITAYNNNFGTNQNPLEVAQIVLWDHITEKQKSFVKAYLGDYNNESLMRILKATIEFKGINDGEEREDNHGIKSAESAEPKPAKRKRKSRAKSKSRTKRGAAKKQDSL